MVKKSLGGENKNMMRILVIWQNHAGTITEDIAHAFYQLGHRVYLMSNHTIPWPSNIEGDGSGYAEILAPGDRQAVWGQEARHRTTLPTENFYQYCMPWSWVYDSWNQREKKRPDLVLVAEGGFNPGGEFPEDWEGIPIMYFACDCPRGPDHHLRQAYCAHATHLLVLGRWYMPYYNMKQHISNCVGKQLHHSGEPVSKIFWLPACAKLPQKWPIPTVDKKYDVLFMGNPGACMFNSDQVVIEPPVNENGDQYFPKPLELLCEAGGWKFGESRQRGTLFRALVEEKGFNFHSRPCIVGDGYLEELAKAKIVWNCQAAYEAGHGSTTNRPYEASLSSSLPCTNLTSEIADLWELEEEVLTYPLSFCPGHHLFGWFDYALMRERIMDVLADDARLKKMTKASRERTLSDHMPINRAQRIIEIARGEDVNPLDYRELDKKKQRIFSKGEARIR
jgi:hypothetical protein